MTLPFRSLFLWAALAGCQGAPPAHHGALPPIGDAGLGASWSASSSVNNKVAPPTPIASTSAAEEIVAEPPKPKNDPRCPAGLFGAEGKNCTGEVAACAYANGDCTCAAPPSCTGFAPPPPKGPVAGSWTCQPTKAKSVSLDGCPFFPEPGIPCTQPGRKCFYPSCSWQRQYVRCDGKKWIPTIESLAAAPP